MASEFTQVEWSEEVVAAARTLVRLAIDEDLGGQCDWTTAMLVPATARATARVVSREEGVLAGMPVARLVIEALDADVELQPLAADGEVIAPGREVAVLQGCARDLLTAERTMLNFLGRLSGIASLTRQYVAAVQGTEAQIYDTRKTTPGWRLLEKYAVRCGGGNNHRLGLNRAVMIKDNHVALAQDEGLDLPAAVDRVRQAVVAARAEIEAVEVEVDSLDQLSAVLPARPDIVLLDNMSFSELREAVELRDKLAPDVILEASGGVTLMTVARIAAAGVDRISSGALTHSARVLDLGLDWGPSGVNAEGIARE